ERQVPRASITGFNGQNLECEWWSDGDQIVSVGSEQDYVAQWKDAKRIDVNHDQQDDWLVFLDGCGAHGRCVHVVLLGCGEGKLHPIWGPAYALDVSVLQVGPERWAELVFGTNGGDLH